MDFIIEHSGMLAMLLFFTMFNAIALWAYWPSNKNKMTTYAHIPLKGEDHG